MAGKIAMLISFIIFSILCDMFISDLENQERALNLASENQKTIEKLDAMMDKQKKILQSLMTLIDTTENTKLQLQKYQEDELGEEEPFLSFTIPTGEILTSIVEYQNVMMEPFIHIFNAMKFFIQHCGSFYANTIDHILELHNPISILLPIKICDNRILHEEYTPNKEVNNVELIQPKCKKRTLSKPRNGVIEVTEVQEEIASKIISEYSDWMFPKVSLKKLTYDELLFAVGNSTIPVSSSDKIYLKDIENDYTLMTFKILPLFLIFVILFLALVY